MRSVIFLTILLIVCTGCASQEPALIEFNTNKHYTNKETINSIEVGEEIVIKPLPADRGCIYNNTEGVLREKQSTETPLVIPKVIHDDKKVIYHEVQPGETLEDLVENYSSPKEEIIEMNDLITPYKLEEFQILKIKITSDTLNKKNREQTPEIIKNRQPNINDLTTNNYIKPLNGTIITKFGEVTKNGKSNGINIEAREGAPVKSIANGTVIRVGNSTQYGNLVIIKLNDINLSVAYAHLEGIILNTDQKIVQGEIVGYVGSSGNVDKAQLHFAIKDGEKTVDPLKYIPDLDS